MYKLFFPILALVFIVNADLTENRMSTAKVWVDRSNSVQGTYLAYSDLYSTDETSHIIREIGDYTWREKALEYDLIINILSQVIGFNPAELRTYWDPSTTKWLDEDTLQVDFQMDIKTAFNPMTGKYLVDMKGFRTRNIYQFFPGSHKVKLEYTINDPAANKAYALNSGSFPPEFLCGYIILPACNVTNDTGYNFLQDTGLSSYQECINFLYSLPTENFCPFPERSNTVKCRSLHGFSSLLLPQVHCSHVRQGSEVCENKCLNGCSDCHPNAECIASFPTYLTPVYSCKCKPGYTGDGKHCEINECRHDRCRATPGSYECSSGLCKCTESFTYEPNNKNNLCSCEFPSRVHRIGEKAICVPEGRCVSDNRECKQKLTQVKCLQPVNNTLTLFASCVCNYGFTGGFEYPCVCGSNKRVVKLESSEEELCLHSWECADNSHCQSYQECVKDGGKLVGVCTTLP